MLPALLARDMHRPPQPARWPVAIGGLVWIGLIAAGLSQLWLYDVRRGAGAEAPRQRPHEGMIADTAAGPTLVMLAHPRCPCTRASIAELARLMAQADGRLRAEVLFVQPPGTADDFVDTDLWHTAAGIPGVHVRRDRDGREAARFGAATSGQVVLYDAAGRRLFQGGLTAARGHEGDNAGRDAVLAALDGARPDDGAVFGCPLQASAAPADKGVPCPM